MITVTQSATAVGAGIRASFRAVGGVAPYTFAVAPNGAGGQIDSFTGRYTAPVFLSDDPRKSYDFITVTDALGAVGSAHILVGLPLLLFCEVIQRGMGLQNGRVYIWDQKIMQPHDSSLYISVSELVCNSIGSSNTSVMVNGELVSAQAVVMQSMLQIDFISRGPEARDRKEELISVLNGDYSRFQQDANSFYIAPLSVNSRFTNLSQVDGAAIPYRYNIPVMIQYMRTRQAAVDYFDHGFVPRVTVDPPVESPEPPVAGDYVDIVWNGNMFATADISAIAGSSVEVALVDIVTLDKNGVPEAFAPSELWGFSRPSANLIKVESALPFIGTTRIFLMAYMNYYDVTFSNETEKTIDVSAEFSDTRYLALVDVISLTEIAAPSESWGFTRPSPGTIKLTAGEPFTGNVRVIVEGVTP